MRITRSEQDEPGRRSGSSGSGAAGNLVHGRLCACPEHGDDRRRGRIVRAACRRGIIHNWRAHPAVGHVDPSSTVAPLNQANIVVTDLSTNNATVYEYTNPAPIYPSDVKFQTLAARTCCA